MTVESAKVLVFGATGAQGIPVVKELLDRQFTVRTFVRDKAKAQTLFSAFSSQEKDAIEIFEGDLLDLATVKSAANGVSAAFFFLPAALHVNEDFSFTAFVETLKDCHLPKLIFTTSNPLMDQMHAYQTIENQREKISAIKKSNIPHVIFRPAFYLNNLLWPMLIREMLQENSLSYPPVAPERKLSWIALEDQAKLVVAALECDDVLGKEIDIASYEAINGTELVNLLSRQLGRIIRFEPCSIEAFENVAGTLLESDYAAEATGEFFEAIAKLPAGGAVFDMTEVLSILPVTLTSVSEWISKQNWTDDAHDAQLLELASVRRFK